MSYSKNDLIKHSNQHISNYISEFYDDAINGGMTKGEAYLFMSCSINQIKSRLLKTELPPACADWCESRDTIVANNVPGMWGFTKQIEEEIDTYQP